MLLSPVYAEEMGASYVQLGLMGAYHAVGYTVITLVTGLLMDRFARARSLALIAYSTNEWMIVVPLALYWLSNGFLEPILLNWIAMNSPLESRSFTMGIYETVFGLGMIVGPMVAGLVTNSYPVSVVYILLTVASMLILPLSIGLD